jgi:hypothetical protein
MYNDSWADIAGYAELAVRYNNEIRVQQGEAGDADTYYEDVDTEF